MSKDWFFGIVENNDAIHRFFVDAKAKPAEFCVHWDRTAKHFILSGIPKKKTKQEDQIEQWKLAATSYEGLKNEVSAAALKTRHLKTPLANKPAAMRIFKLKEVFATSASSEYSSNADNAINSHFTLVT